MMVTIQGDGMVGQNQEMALAALRAFQCNPRFLFMSPGTDGIDGHSDAAGALVDHASWKQAQELGLRIYDYLVRNDSYYFLKQSKDLILPVPRGPTSWT